MPRKSKISIVDYSAGSEKSIGNTIAGHMVSAKHLQLSPDEATKQGIEQTCEKPMLSKELPNADSPEFQAWATQNGEVNV